MTFWGLPVVGDVLARPRRRFFTSFRMTPGVRTFGQGDNCDKRIKEMSFQLRVKSEELPMKGDDSIWKQKKCKYVMTG